MGTIYGELYLSYIYELFFFFLKRQYVVYPPEGPLPPSPEELMERAREARKAREFARQTNNQ